MCPCRSSCVAAVHGYEPDTHRRAACGLPKACGQRQAAHLRGDRKRAIRVPAHRGEGLSAASGAVGRVLAKVVGLRHRSSRPRAAARRATAAHPRASRCCVCECGRGCTPPPGARVHSRSIAAAAAGWSGQERVWRTSHRARVAFGAPAPACTPQRDPNTPSPKHPPPHTHTRTLNTHAPRVTPRRACSCCSSPTAAATSSRTSTRCGCCPSSCPSTQAASWTRRPSQLLRSTSSLRLTKSSRWGTRKTSA
jgi:hypothetical protein